MEITSDWNKIIETLSSYKKYKFRFIIKILLFSANLQVNTFHGVIFRTCGGLAEAKTALINSKLYKILGVICLLEIKDQDLIKSDSKRVQAVFVDTEYHSKTSHFAFAFNTKNVSDMFNF